jgi:hypothetical protein
VQGGRDLVSVDTEVKELDAVLLQELCVRCQIAIDAKNVSARLHTLMCHAPPHTHTQDTRRTQRTARAFGGGECTQVLVGVGLGAEVEDGLEAHLLKERKVLLVGIPRTIPATFHFIHVKMKKVNGKYMIESRGGGVHARCYHGKVERGNEKLLLIVLFQIFHHVMPAILIFPSTEIKIK